MNHSTLPHDGDASQPLSKPYITTELDIASYLMAFGHRLIQVLPTHGYLVEFHFDSNASAAMPGYFAGAALPVVEVFKAHRHLRALVKQTKIHNGVTSNAYQRKY